MKLTLDDESRLPIRAAVAVALALAFGEVSNPGLRWYWAALVAAVLVSGTWGESTKRGLTRFSMTVVGAAAGWDLHVFFGHTHAARVAIMLLAIFWAVYFRGWSYAWFTFFITVYVVSLFEVLEAPTGIITLLRVYQTFVGCGLAMAAALFVPMPRASDQWEADASEFLKICRSAAGRSYDRLLRQADASVTGSVNTEPETGVIPQLDKLRKDFQSASYEAVLDRATHRRRRTFMEESWRLGQVVLSLDSVARIDVRASVLAELRDELATLRSATVTSADPETTPSPDRVFETFRARLNEARREEKLLAGDYLVLDAVAQFSTEMAVMAQQAERGLKGDNRLD